MLHANLTARTLNVQCLALDVIKQDFSNKGSGAKNSWITWMDFLFLILLHSCLRIFGYLSANRANNASSETQTRLMHYSSWILHERIMSGSEASLLREPISQRSFSGDRSLSVHRKLASVSASQLKSSVVRTSTSTQDHNSTCFCGLRTVYTGLPTTPTTKRAEYEKSLLSFL